MSISTEHVWEQLSTKIADFIRRRVTGGDTAADILQETFVRIHSGLPQLRDEDRLSSWVLQVARNVIIDHYRESRPSAALESDVVDTRPTCGGNSKNHNEEVSRWLPPMIDSLPEGYRDALRLAEIDGLTQRQVGERLGLSLSGAKSRVQRGRELLKRMLLECCHFDFDRRGNIVDYERHGGCSGCTEC